MRYNDWKLVFLEQRPGMLEAWTELLLTPLFSLPLPSGSGSPFVQPRAPKLFNLRTDPYEHADFTSDTHRDWMSDGGFLLVPSRARLAKFLASFSEFPAHQKPPSLTVDRVIGTLSRGFHPGRFAG
jgi:arylsulfatase